MLKAMEITFPAIKINKIIGIPILPYYIGGNVFENNNDSDLTIMIDNFNRDTHV
jgi:hypothetical protein